MLTIDMSKLLMHFIKMHEFFYQQVENLENLKKRMKIIIILAPFMPL